MSSNHARRPLRLPIVQLVLFAVAVSILASAGPAQAQSARARLSRDLAERLAAGDLQPASVIVAGSDARIDAIAARHGLRVSKRLRTGAVLEVPGVALAALAADADVDALSSNQVLRSQMDVTNQAIGADLVHAGAMTGGTSVTGAGVGVAVIDSGVAVVPELKGRVVFAKDFTGTGTRDLHGHGTHVAGIIAAGGRQGDTTGVAPGAHIVSLKVLDAEGKGDAASVIEAIDFAIANQARFNIRVINLSLGGAPLQPWRDDPLCQAVERAYRAGIFVVAAAGNKGRLADGRTVYGGITTPGISPFAFTVGALNTKGTAWPGDDEVASYSSKGPTYIDRLLKPDLVAPGNRIRSLAAPASTLVQEHPELVFEGPHGRELELSGTSMAAAVMSGAAAVIVERKPTISNLPIRLRLQFGGLTGSGGLVQRGAGSLNLLSALMAPSRPEIVVGGETVRAGGMVFAHREVLMRALMQTVVWGADDTVVWGAADTVVWGADDTVVWGADDTVVWGADDTVVWGADDTIVWGADETAVWGGDDTVVWGAADTVVWGAGVISGD